VRIAVLGPVRAWRDELALDLGPARQRGLLGLLALAAGHPIGRAELVDALWPDRPPPSAIGMIHTNVKRLRHVLEPDRAPYRPSAVLPAVGDGYALSVPPGTVDAQRFRDLVAAATRARRAGRPESAAATFGEALALWAGPPLADVPGLAGHPAVSALGTERYAALVGHGQALAAAGQWGEAVATLREAATTQPLDETVQAWLIRGYQALGRRAEAVAVHQDLRRRLATELGVDPGPEVVAAYAAVLGEPGPAAAARAVPTGRAAGVPAWRPHRPAGKAADRRPGPWPVPAQLPVDVRGFTGRAAPLRVLDRLLAAGRPAEPVVISAVSGMAGVGKTALAVHWAHRVADCFPGGQLYLDLRGFGPGPSLGPAEALRRLLAALEVPAYRIPADVDAQAALYRSVLAGRRVLVLLDNARDDAQVRPLLPGSPGCLAVITSRNQLAGLVTAEGAYPVELDPLSPAEATDLLAARLGPDRVSAEPTAVAEIVARCGRLPLALAVVAARAAWRPDIGLGHLADQLRSSGDPLDMLSVAGDPQADVLAVFSWSYRALPPPAARLLRHLGLHPGPDLDAAAAASLAAIPPPEAAALLDTLARANLVAEHGPGRYTLHDLLHAYAARLAAAEYPPDRLAAAAGRLLDHYLHTAHRAATLLEPPPDPITPAPPRPGVTPVPLTDERALAWFAAEHRVLLAMVEYAATNGFDTHAWQLTHTLRNFLHRSGHWLDQIAVGRTAVAAADRLADPAARIRAHRLLGDAYLRMARFDEAGPHLLLALDLATRAGDPAAQAHLHLRLSFLHGGTDDHAGAGVHARQALRLYRKAGHPLGEADALNNLGWHHIMSGEHEQALTRCGSALTLHQHLGNLAGQAGTWDTLGVAHHHLGQHDDALACLQRALDLFRHLGDRYHEADTLAHLADARHAAGQAEAARSALTRSLEILTDLDHPQAAQIRARLADATNHH
jgi:DNA-binding SARP family transcriptional activator